MYNYYKSFDGQFTHYYRVKEINVSPNSRNFIECLHVNVTSSCINEGLFLTEKNYEVVGENEFNEALDKVMNDLGINIKKFKFV